MLWGPLRTAPRPPCMRLAQPRAPLTPNPPSRVWCVLGWQRAERYRWESGGGEGGQTTLARSSRAAAQTGVEDPPEGRPGRLGESVAAACQIVGILCACVRVHVLDVYAVFKEAKTPRAGDRVPSFCLSFWTCPIQHGVCPPHVARGHLKCSPCDRGAAFSFNINIKYGLP